MTRSGYPEVLRAHLGNAVYEGKHYDWIALPIHLVRDVPLALVDRRAWIEPTEESDGVLVENFPPDFRVRVIAPDRAEVLFFVELYRSSWRLPGTPVARMWTLIKRVERASRSDPSIRLISYSDGGSSWLLSYAAAFSGRTLGDVLIQAEKFERTIIERWDVGPKAKRGPQTPSPDPRPQRVHVAILEHVKGARGVPDRSDLCDAFEGVHGSSIVHRAVKELHAWGFVDAPPRSKHGVSLTPAGRAWLEAHPQAKSTFRPARQPGHQQVTNSSPASR